MYTPNVSAHAGVTPKKKKIKRKNSVKPTMNVFTEIAVSGYLLQRSLAGFPKFEKKKKKKKKENAKTYTNTSDGAPPSSVQSNIWIFFRLC